MDLDLFFLPHGPQIIEGLEEPFNEAFRDTSDAMKNVKEIFNEKRYEAIILITPHGYNLSDSFLIFNHTAFNGDYYKIKTGDSVEYDELSERRRWIGNSDLNEKIASKLEDHDLPYEVLVQGFDGYPITLAWGEVVPLYFSVDMKTKISILGLPRARHEKIFEIQPQLLLISKILLALAKNSQEKICLIFSGDLSHTHTSDGPYGFHESSKPFDKLIQAWASKPTREQFEQFLQLQPTALACGMAGMSILQGIFDTYEPTINLVHYSLPTYFGMGTFYWSINLPEL